MERQEKCRRGLVLCGMPGTGKTHLAVSIAREIAGGLQESVFITTAARIIRAFRRTWSGNSEFSELDVLAKYCDPDLLIIDEIGVQYGTDSERNILFEVINDRYESLLPTILVSNLPLNELEEMLGERVVDRLLQGGTVLTFNWATYRRGNHL
ncbi:DNA replication protein dnaC [Providencia rustigianii]|nr:DNA replication protein dnaC [Providencia rustigianii]